MGAGLYELGPDAMGMDGEVHIAGVTNSNRRDRQMTEATKDIIAEAEGRAPSV